MPAPVTANFASNPLQSGMTWSANFHSGPNVKQLASYSAASPVVVTTATPHGYTTGEKKVIAGCSQNPTLNNTPTNETWTITVIDSTSFSLTGSMGVLAATNEGIIFDALDATGATVYVIFVSDSSSNAVVQLFTNAVSPTSPIQNRFTFTGSAPSGTFAWIQQTSNYFTCTLTSAQTKALASAYSGSLFGFYIFVDSSGVASEPVYLQLPIVP